MNLSKVKQEKLDAAYETLIQVCLYDMPLEAMEPYLAEDVMNFGAGKTEITTAKATFLEQIKGQKNLAEDLKMDFTISPILRKITSKGKGAIYTDDIVNTVLINGVKNELIFRLSFIFEYLKDRWVLIHSHTSTPDSQRSDDEVWPVEELKRRTEVLEKSLDEKIAELEIKNRDLEIEAALERVRAVAMSMSTPKDLQQVGEIIFTELKELGLSQLRNTEIIINHDEKESITSYYYSDYGVTGIIDVDYTTNPTLKSWAEEIHKADDAFAEVIISENEIDEWREYRTSLGYVPDPKLNTAKSVYYYSYSIGLGALSISLFEPISAQGKNILEQFRNVFNLAYQRYYDISLAEAQAREAQIEAAIEKVRAASMAMHKTDELAKVVEVLFQQFSDLNLDFYQVWINIFLLEEGYSNCWFSPVEGVISEAYTAVVPLGPFEESSIKSWRAGEEFSYLSWSGLEAVDKLMKNLSEMTKHSSFQEIQKKKRMNRVEIVDCNHKYGVMAMAKNEDITDNDRFILKRFTKVFEQTYTRFLDLQKAEAQAREAQIEASLERVRASSMAMHSSEELAEVAKVMFDQMKMLGGELFAFGIVLCDKHKNTVEQWHSLGEGGMMTPFQVPIDLDYIHRYRYDQWKAGEELFSIEIPSDYIEQHFELMFALPSVEVFKEDLAAQGIDISPPPWEIDYGASFRNGYLLVSSLEPFEEKNIFPRFAKVFEQAYTRFLDLKKAEAQAREAKIEASLERIRSRTMAMHSSEELTEAANLLFLEVQGLGIPTWSAGYNILSDDKQSAQCWMSSEGAMQDPFTLHYNGDESLKEQHEFFLSNDNFLVQELSGKALKAHYANMKTMPKVGEIIIELENSGISLPNHQINHLCKFEQGYLLFITYEPVPEAYEIFQRFTKVFEQTYTRFLDLQKAEEQAREAQIETALERVRSTSMAMHDSKDLHTVIVAVYNQLKALGLELHSTQIAVSIEDEKAFHIWNAANGQIYPKLIHIPYSRNIFFTRFRSALKNGESFFTLNMTKKQKDSFFRHYFNKSSHQDVPKSRQDFIFSTPGIGFSTAVGKYTCLAVLRYDRIPYSNDENEIIKRFAKVFEQSYTRFLDLQKAESQAREAQIEAALERVRSRSMAMHQSEELADLSLELVKQVQALGVATWFCAFNIYDDHPDGSLEWGSNGEGTFPRYRTPREGIFLRYYEAGQRGETLLVHEIGEKECPAHYEYLCTLPGVGDQLLKMKDEGIPFPTYQIDHVAFFKYGYILYITYEPVPETHDIFKRFAKVFEQTYTRFLDLQKAEAQAREAQIEVALERIRARSMAMHKSSEMLEVADVLFQQLRSLGGNLWGCGVLICKSDTDDDEVWFANENGVLPPVLLPHTEDPTHKKMYEGWVNKLELYSEFKEGQELKKHYDYMLSVPAVKPLFENILASGLTFPTWQKWHAAYFSQGYLLFITLEHYEEEQIFTRFAKVFDQAYTRFLDLQKAEAQAREAQIEVAVERVRAKALAMQNSSQILEVVSTLRNEMLGLEIPGVAAATIYLQEDDDHIRMWDLSSVQELENGFRVTLDVKFKLDETHPDLFIRRVWNNKEQYFIERQEKEDMAITLEWLRQYHPKQADDAEKFLSSNPWNFLLHPTIQLANGKMSVDILDEEAPAEMQSIMTKMGAAFDLAYKRFLDLQRKEVQLREAEIEAAMERVRSKAMSMQKADELVDVAVLLRKEMGLLGVEELETSSIYIHDESSGKTECWFSIQDQEQEDKLISDHMTIDLNDTWVGQQMQRFYRSAKKQQTSIVMQGTKRTEWINYCAEESDLFSVSEFYGENIPARTYHLYKFSNGYMGAASPGTISDESWNLLRRATSVFSLAYTRFSDLQTAEAQTRESQVELALERARNQSMLMQHSDELNKVSNVFHEQLLQLGIPSEFSYVWLPNEEKQTHMFWATWSENLPAGKAGKKGTITSRSKAITNPLDKTEPYTAACYEMWDKDQSVFVNPIPPEEVEEFFTSWTELLSDAEHMKPELFPDGLYYAEAYMRYGCFGINIRRPLTEEEEQVLQRFSIEFERAYTRFLDLQKAEAQTREAQIEASLERVRASAMAMHHPDELDEVLAVLCEQFDVLGILPMSTHMTVFDLENNVFTFRETGKFGDRSFGEQTVDINAMDTWKSTVEQWEANTAFAVNRLHFPKESLPQVWEVFRESFASMPEGSRITPDDYPHGIYHTAGKHPYGYIGMNQVRKATEEEEEIVIKFASEFGRAYTRFLDLQKAEEQAREAQIEAALEKVRSRTMAMHDAEELHEVVTLVVEKLKDLGVILDANGVVLCTYFQDSKDVLHWIASPDFSFSGSYLLPYFDHPIFSDTWESRMSGADYFSKAFSVEEKNSFYEYAFEHSDYRNFPDEFKEWVFQNDKHSLSFAWSTNAAILIPSHTGVVPSETQIEILKRFAKVFEQAYVRFMDLQKAEKAARETQIELSLERIRSQVTGMMASSDLLDIVVAMRKEFVALGHETHYFWHMRWLLDTYEKAMTSGDGTRIGTVMKLPRRIHGEIKQLAEWEKGDEPTVVYVMDVEATMDYVHKMVEWGDFQQVDPNMPTEEDINHLGGLTYIMARTKHGEIGYSLPGMVPNPPEEDIKTLIRFADAFDLAYRRFEDLQKAEAQALLIKEEKERLEVTLENLKATQAQLVQSEKMASLGELTAGIAHEIQNPLNFVNNFSEVSAELIDEAKEELASTPLSEQSLNEARDILNDLKQNLEKIHHHGGRADSIVKGMLEHSRTSTGEKAPTDINELADEYLRLAYHGLRAKDPTFNAAFETNLDPDLTKINVIPQDIGRVLLNLINNAFQAVHEKSQIGIENYQPKVTLSTLRLNDSSTLQLTISDNGSGIPDSIKDKIFQPFFTTKPTGEGTGLGLSLSYDIVKAHGGEITVESEVGKGTAFIINLPFD